MPGTNNAMWSLLTVTAIILAGTLENILPLIVGYAQTPPGMVFLGTIHHPDDYFYYLSQFTQGATRMFTTRDLYTGEAIPASFVGWSNVLMGKIGWLLGVNAQITYGLSVIILTILIFYAAYSISVRFVGKRTGLIALFLFVLYHAFPVLVDGKFGYHDYWNNYAAPSVRLGGVPHQLFFALSSFLIAYFALRYVKNHNRRWLLGIIVCAAILASLQPVLWVLLTASLIVLGITPAFASGAGGIIPALYLSQLFKTEPFLQLKLWEATQNNHLTLTHFLLSTGPIAVMALFALPVLFKTKFNDAKWRFALVFPSASFLLLLSPLPHMFGLTEVRFMSALVILCVSVIASYGLASLPRTYRVTILILLTLLLIPSHIRTVNMTTQFDPKNAYQYLTASDYRFLADAGKRGGKNDTFLLIWPYDVVFPGITGQKSFNGHQLLTINAGQKDKESSAFFAGTMTDSAMHLFVNQAHITYVIGYNWSPKLYALPFLHQTLTSDNLVLYHVIK